MTFSARPFSTRPTYPSEIEIGYGEHGYAAWSYSRASKLNAWSWHGLGGGSGVRPFAWASLGRSVYMRQDGSTEIRTLRPDAFFSSEVENSESSTVIARTQWLDFGKPGNLKALTACDFDGQNILAVRIYSSVGGNRDGVFMQTIPVIDADQGWTYSGGLLPVSAHGTEFMLEFVADPLGDAEVNRFSLHFDDLGLM